MKQIKHISYSYIHTFSCPYAAFLRYEASIKQKPTDSLALGNALHYAIELSNKAGWNVEDASKLFLTEFRRIVEDDEVFVTWPKMKKHEAEGIEMLALYDYGIKESKFPAVPFESEKEFKLPFEDEIIIVGKIDRTDKEGDEYIVTDYKSGAREPDPWFLRHDLQFTTYAWAMQELTGKIPKKLIWHHLRNGKLLVTERTQQDIDELKVMLHQALEMNRQDIRYRVYHSQVCNWCDFKGDVCDDRELEKTLVSKRKELLNVG